MFLTVGIPVYNGMAVITRAISSVLNQTYFPSSIELLIVDDGSTDNTVEVIKNFVAENNIRFKQHNILLKVISHETNKGRVEARKTLVDNASGDLFAFLDADDEWTHDKLARQIPFFLTKQAIYGDRVLVCGNVTYIETNGRRHIRDFYKKYKGDFKSEYGLYNMLAVSQTGLMMTEIAREINFDSDIDDAHGRRVLRAEDRDFLLRFCVSGGLVFLLENPPLANYYNDLGNASGEDVVLSFETFRERHSDVLANTNPKLYKLFLAKGYYSIARYYKSSSFAKFAYYSSLTVLNYLRYKFS